MGENNCPFSRISQYPRVLCVKRKKKTHLRRMLARPFLKKKSFLPDHPLKIKVMLPFTHSNNH